MKRLITFAFLLIFLLTSEAKGIKIKTDSVTGAISYLGLENDSTLMNWVLSPDGKQYSWVTSKYGWGLGYLTINGETKEWNKPIQKDDKGNKVCYQVGHITISVERIVRGDELIEQYSFKNNGKEVATISDCGIYTPWNDNYPDAKTCLTSRCHAHIWAGDAAAYVCAIRMGDNGKNNLSGTGNIGLILTKGSISDYEIWERTNEQASSNYRGVISMDLPDMKLLPGKSYTVAWTILEHGGKQDFSKKLIEKGSMFVKSDKYVYQQGEDVSLYLQTAKGKPFIATMNGKSIKTSKDSKGYCTHFTTNELGEHRIDLQYGGKKTHANILVVSNYDSLISKRVQFILENQQMNDPNDARYGAYMVYDNEKNEIYKNDDKRESYDTNEGRERVGMGLLLAKWYLLHPDEKIKESLIRYASFIRNKLQTEDYTVYSRVNREDWIRGYNFTWVADFYFNMYEVTKNPQYAIDGYQTMQALYRHTNYGFYCIDIPVTTSLRVLKQAGLQTEYNKLLIDYAKTAAVFMKNGLNFPKFEVNYEQSIIAPAVQFLLELYLQTKDESYLATAKEMLPMAENFCGFQPDYRLHEIAIRHWDCYWFGKRQLYGDTFPHYWSTINANAYNYYAQATGDKSYIDKAKEIVRNNLCNISEGGKGSCAFVYPKRINGQKAHFADVFANDQDWALVFYLQNVYNH